MGAAVSLEEAASAQAEDCEFSHEESLIKAFKTKECRYGAKCSFHKNGRCIFGVHKNEKGIDEAHTPQDIRFLLITGPGGMREAIK